MLYYYFINIVNIKILCFEFLLQDDTVPLKGLLIKSPHSSFENKPPTNILHVLGSYKSVKKKKIIRTKIVTNYPHL